jgi:hypothetical protein
MTLSRCSLRSKPQRGEDRIVGGGRRLAIDPCLHLGQTLRGLMDIISLGDVGERFEQLLETGVAFHGRRGSRGADAASRRAHDRPHFFDLSHPSAFPSGIASANRDLLAAG